MRAIASLAVATAALMGMGALAGCNQLGLGGGGSGNVTANAATANSAASSAGKDGAGNNTAAADTAAAPAGGLSGKDSGTSTQASAGGVPTLDRAFVIGRWTDKGDCSDGVEFSPDGRFVTANGGGGLWNLEGSEMTMSGNAQTITMRIVPVDQNTMTVVNQDGSLGRSTRC
jgi:hypothetical protein